MLALLLVGLVLLGMAGVLVLNLMLAPARERRAALAQAAGYSAATFARPRAPFRERVGAPVVVWLARVALRLSPRTSVDLVRRRLIAAGLSRRLTPTGFLAAKVGVVLGGVLLGVLLASVGGKPVLAIPMAAVLALLGWVGSEFALSRMATARAEQISSDLPKAIDMLAVSVEAGLGLDASIAKLVERMRGPLIDELNLTLGEVRIGESREQALRRLAERVPAPELGSFVRAVVTSEQLGISLGKILRTQAAELRHRRQMQAEERAMKAPVKMLFPTVLLIFPAMFVVILGPAMMTLMEIFK